MKISEFIRKNNEVLPKELAKMLAEEQSIWTNDACYGYLILGMRYAGFDEEHIKSAVRAMNRAFDELTVEEAEEFWRKW